MPLLDLVSRTGRGGTINITTIKSTVTRLRITGKVRRVKKYKNGQEHRYHYSRSSNSYHGGVKKQKEITTTTGR
jgi:phosphotransferase system IIB component